MKLYKIVVLPFGSEKSEFQNNVNDLIKFAFKDAWEFEYILTHVKKPIIIFSREETSTGIKDGKNSFSASSVIGADETTNPQTEIEESDKEKKIEGHREI